MERLIFRSRIPALPVAMKDSTARSVLAEHSHGTFNKADTL